MLNNKKSPLALMHLDAFLLENQRRTLLWLIGIYFANTLMAFILTWANQSLVEPSIYVVTQVTRATIMGLQGFAIISVYRSQVRWVQAAILSAISLGLSLAIFLPSMYAVIATIAFTITLITTLFVISTLFQNTKLNLLTIATSIIAFNLFSLSLAINPVVTVKITPELIAPVTITMNFLLLLVSLFVITIGVGLNRLRFYISDLVYIDLKTQLYNERQLDFEISSVINKGEEFILLAIDFKNLLALNRQHGYRAVHPVFLHQIELIKRAMMPYGMPFKLEGPIFAFILKLDHHMLAQVEQSISQLSQQLRAKGLEGNSSANMEHQWLATQYPTDGESAQQLIDNLYHLKYVIDGKVSPIRWYDQATYDKVKRTATLEKDLHVAVHEGLLEIVLQPQLTIANQSLRGFEVLSRWRHSDYGPISPAEFIPMLERLGLMNAFTENVLKKSIELDMDFAAKGLGLKALSVNIAATSISDGSILAMVHTVNRPFEIEITENTLMELNEGALETLAQLKQRGFKISIDDFGTGFSNLEYLHSLDVDYLKIDKRFIDSMMTSEKALKLVEALIAMAHTLDIEVVAEGVETKMQYDVLVDLKCDFIQGYWYAKPLTPDQIFSFVENNTSQNAAAPLK